MKRLSLLIAVLLTLLLPATAYAAEITPSADSYGYGSTSEFSSSSTLSVNNSSDLADTGDNTNTLKLVAMVLVIIGIAAGARLLIQRNEKH